jgi:hypothetical protein
MTSRNKSSKKHAKRSTTANRSGSAHGEMVKMEKTLEQLLNSQDLSRGKIAPPISDIMFPPIRRNGVHTFVRSYNTTITVTSTTDSTFAYAFALSSFPDYTEFTALFDSYRIQQTRVSFTNIAFAGGSVLANMHTVIDYDDNNVIGVSAMQEYETYQVDTVESSFSRTLNPRAANAAYSGAFTSFSQMPTKTWCDVASPNILYYGLKGIIPASTFAGGPLAVLEVTVSSVLQFKNTR